MDVLAEALDLTRRRRPFVLATVIGRRGPTSGRQGAKAIIDAGGILCGWLGGACAEPSVVRLARETLATGEPMVVMLGDLDPAGAGSVSGGAGSAGTVAGADTRRLALACDSDGALEVYLEPHLPVPQVVVVGRSPAVDALAEIACAVGWSALVIDDAGDPETHTRPELVRTKLDFDDLVVDAATAVVVATQGHYDDLALAAALRTCAGYVGLVASRRRAAAVLEHLADSGVAPDELARVNAPAGLDLGEVAHAEIAASVMADLVRRRAAGELAAPVGAAEGSAAVPAPARREAVDPVCAMTVFVDDARYHVVHDGADYWFCSAGCRRKFLAAPRGFLPA